MHKTELTKLRDERGQWVLQVTVEGAHVRAKLGNGQFYYPADAQWIEDLTRRDLLDLRELIVEMCEALEE